MYDRSKYFVLKENPIQCLFCQKSINLWSLNRHFNTQFCLTRRELLKNSMDESEFNKLQYDFLLFIDSTKNELKKNT